MKNFYLNSEEKGIVVFLVMKSLSYNNRMIISLLFIMLGLVLQFITFSFFAGCLPIIIGNALLVVKGYDNRVKFGNYSPSVGWEIVDKDQVESMEVFNKKIKKWDRSLMDISCGQGMVIFMLLLVVCLVLLSFGHYYGDNSYDIIALDILILMLPHWLTGLRRILTKPNISLKVGIIKNLISEMDIKLSEHKIDYFMLLQGNETKVPKDVKFRISFTDQKSGFLGLYGQVVINKVKDSNYPYFYVVLVAKTGFGLFDVFSEKFKLPPGAVKEYTTEKDVEVLIIRQKTTKTTGYHTKPETRINILNCGLTVAKKAAV